MKNFLKKAFGSLAGVFGFASVALAEGSGSNAVDLSGADLSSIVDALKTWVGTATPWVLGVLGAFMVVSLIFIAYKWIKKAGNRG